MLLRKLRLLVRKCYPDYFFRVQMRVKTDNLSSEHAASAMSAKRPTYASVPVFNSQAEVVKCNGMEALEYLKNTAYVVYLLRLKMPVVSRRESCCRNQAHGLRNIFYFGSNRSLRKAL